LVVVIRVIRRSWRNGFRCVAAAPAVIGGVYIITLLAALPLATALAFGISEHLGSSLAANEVADSVNYDWWQEFASQGSPVSLNSTFTPSILGFATTLDSVSGLLDARPIVPAIGLALAFYVLAWMFLQGAILDRYARGRRMGAYGFFAASGTFFFRFLRLGIVAAAAYWFLFAYVHQWLFARWYVNVTRDIAVERTAFYWRVLMYAIFTALLALTTIVFDYAKVRAVVEDRRSMAGALFAGARFISRNPSRVAGLYLANTMLLLIVVGMWALVDPGAGGSGASLWAGVAVSQCYIVARLIVKLQFLASETALFQRSLAHWGYTAATEAVRSKPAIVETL
jgi:hypothetical protein